MAMVKFEPVFNAPRGLASVRVIPREDIAIYNDPEYESARKSFEKAHDRIRSEYEEKSAQIDEEKEQEQERCWEDYNKKHDELPEFIEFERVKEKLRNR